MIDFSWRYHQVSAEEIANRSQGRELLGPTVGGMTNFHQYLGRKSPIRLFFLN